MIAERMEEKFSSMCFTIEQEIRRTESERQRPSVLMRPVLTLDGNKWIALYGENLQEGVAGCGDSPAEAMSDFDVNWYKKLNL